LELKLALITVAASLLGAVLVTASNAADSQDFARQDLTGNNVAKNQDRERMAERAEPVRLAEVSPCAPAPETFVCVRGPGGMPDDRRGPPKGAAPGSDRPFPLFGRGSGPDPLMLASRLGAIETFIGINADQLDSWRGYTDALQAIIRPPAPPEDFKGEAPDALTQSAMLARHAAERGQYALRLAGAVEELRGKLAPEQLERLKQAGSLLPPHPGFGAPGFGPPPFPSPASFGPSGPGGPGAGGHITPP
jgi:hypothetical protein